MKKKPNICHASLSFIGTDQRILRQINTLKGCGFAVTAVGYDAGVGLRFMSLKEKLLRAVRQIPSRVFGAQWSEKMYWKNTECLELYHAILKSEAEIVHAHDWEALPAAAMAARKLGAKLIYDSHEVAQEMRSDRLLWRIVYPGFIRDLEDKYITDANEIITVSDYCSNYLVGEYDLGTNLTVVRNCPHYQAMPLNLIIDDEILIHYHGILTSGRGLTGLIKLLAQLPDRFRLRITGPEKQAGFCSKLTALASELDCNDRLEITPFEPHETLIQHANTADIGIFIPELNTGQQQGAAPNKIFEYMMAGLMIVSVPAQEFEKIHRESNVGFIVSPSKIQETAKRIDALSNREIEKFKQNSLQAARQHCWENEQQKLISIYNSLS